MSFIVGGSGGGFSLISTSAAAALEYDPVVGAVVEQDGRLFYEVMPDIYSLLADYDQLPVIWSGYMQIVSDLLLQLICMDSARSLVDVPLDAQRKYQRIDLYEVKEFVFDQLPTIKGDSAAYAFNSSTQTLDVTYRSKLGLDRAVWPLRSQVDQRACLRWSWTATYSSFSDGCVGYAGYLNSESTNLANSLLVGVGQEGRVFVSQVSSTGAANSALTTPVIPLDTEVTVSVTFGGEASPVVVVNVVNTETQVSLLTDFTYNLLDGSASELFVVDSFGLVNLDLSTSNSSSLIPSPPLFSLFVGGAVEAQVQNLGYLDPSLASPVQDIPFLQDSWVSPSIFWTKTVEFNVYALNALFLSFAEQPPDFLLAEYVSYNLELVRNNYGLSVGLDGDNTAAYKSRVQALHYAFWKGPTIGSIRVGVQVLLGLPFAAASGTVINVNPAYSGDEGEITIRGTGGDRRYRYPLEVTPVVSIGDLVAQFAPLVDGVLVEDWKNTPDWFKPYLGDDIAASTPGLFSTAMGWRQELQAPKFELQKYHLFSVSVNADVFDIALLTQIQDFISAIKPTWKGSTFGLFKEISDDVSVGDELEIDITVELLDHIGPSTLVAPHYGDPGEPPYSFQFGQVAPPLTYGMFNEMEPDDPLEIEAVNIDAAPQAIIFLGTPSVVPPGGSVSGTVP